MNSPWSHACVRKKLRLSAAHTSLYTVLKKGAVLTRSQFRPSGHAHKRAFDKLGNREGTEPPAKRTRSSLNGKAFEFLKLSAYDDGEGDNDEYHTPTGSRRGSIYTLELSNQGSEDSYRDPRDLRQAEDQTTGEGPQAISGDSVRLASSRRSEPKGQQIMSVRERSVPRDRGRFDQEFAHSRWQDMHSRLVALEESMSASKQHAQQESWPATMSALDSRILRLEREGAGLGVSSLEEGIKRLESMLERERRERRFLANKLEGKNNSLTHDVAVLQGENEGLRERLNKLTGKVKSVADGRAYRSREEKEQSC